MTLRKVGRLAIDLLAGALVLSALASLTGVPARLTGHGSDDSAGIQRPFFVQPAGAEPTPVPACEQPTLIGRVALKSVAVRNAPTLEAAVVARFPRINSQGAPQVFDLIDSAEDATGDVWFKAVLPMRPNGTTGYLPTGSVQLFQTSYRIVVDREHLRLTLFKGCSEVEHFRIGLGKESTPTPNGTFYINSLLKPPAAGSVYGNYAYGLSAFSNAITNWKGGGIIGIHGTNDPSSIGNRKSHGCIRLDNKNMSKLVPLLPLGTPVEIK